MKRLQLDHVERLSRGKRSGLNIGSRSVGHYLRPHERLAYQRALKKGYLDITENDRENLWHIWEKACTAMESQFLVLIKEPSTGNASIYCANQLHAKAELSIAKKQIKLMLKPD
ncbi:MAG: hypothetical protein ACI9FR_001904 [Cryomorphaceae bacterium]|jgi:hypothetical protein